MTPAERRLLVAVAKSLMAMPFYPASVALALRELEEEDKKLPEVFAEAIPVEETEEVE